MFALEMCWPIDILRRTAQQRHAGLLRARVAHFYFQSTAVMTEEMFHCPKPSLTCHPGSQLLAAPRRYWVFRSTAGPIRFTSAPVRGLPRCGASLA
jgi:hypothetical protein